MSHAEVIGVTTYIHTSIAYIVYILDKAVKHLFGQIQYVYPILLN